MEKVTLFIMMSIFITTKADDPLCNGLPHDQEILFPSPTSCEEYFRCFNGIFSVEECKNGLVFSNKWQRCVEPEYSECTGGTGIPPNVTTPSTSSVTTASTTSVTTTPSTTTPYTTTWISTTTDGEIDPRCVNSDTNYWPHPSRCDKYIECYEGGSYEMDCPPNTYFSDVHKKCGDASQSECCLETPSLCT